MDNKNRDYITRFVQFFMFKTVPFKLILSCAHVHKHESPLLNHLFMTLYQTHTKGHRCRVYVAYNINSFQILLEKLSQTPAMPISKSFLSAFNTAINAHKSIISYIKCFHQLDV